MNGADIFDPRAIIAHRTRAAASLHLVTPILDDLAERLLDRLEDTKNTFTHALDFGGRASIAPRLAARGMMVVSADLSATMAATGPLAVTTGEALPFAPASFDLIIAAMSLHWINDLPGLLLQLRRCLKPGGLFLASIPVLGTLQALRTALLEAEYELTGQVSPRISPLPDLRDCAGLLQRAGFALPVADAEDIEFAYANPLAILHDLRHAGEANATAARSRIIPRRTLFAAALSRLPQKNGRIIVTLRHAVMTGWAS